MILPTLKQASIALGLYRPARIAHRAIFPAIGRKFRDRQRLFSLFLKPGDLVFDVGANIGEFTEVFLSIGAKVVAFEPQPKCAGELRARGTRNLAVVEQAVGDQCGIAHLHLKQADVEASMLPDWQGGPNLGAIAVPMTTLDQAIVRYDKPVFIKIDVEGFEAEVLKGLSAPINLNFEFHCHDRGVAKVRFRHPFSAGRFYGQPRRSGPKRMASARMADGRRLFQGFSCLCAVIFLGRYFCEV
jgi:FkbM family methyltransferase